MKKKNLFILIENSNRELASKLVLSLKAINRNYRVIIGHKGTVWSIFKYFNPGVVLLKSIGEKNTEIIKFLKKNKFKVTSTDEEIILAWDYREAISRRTPKENLMLLDKYLAVGKNHKKALIETYPDFSEKKVDVIGNVRLDMFKEPFKQKYLAKHDYYKTKYGKFVLLATSQWRVNGMTTKKHTLGWYFNKISEGHNTKTQTMRTNKILSHMHRDVTETMSEFILNFEKNFPETNLVVSPHPGENISYWEDLINNNNLKKVFLNKESTSNLISACDILVTSNSTIILEAFLLRKNCINVLANEFSKEFYQEVEVNILKNLSINARGFDELNIAVKKYKEGGLFSLNYENFNEDINNLNDETKFDLLLDSISDLDIEQHNDLYLEKFNILYLSLIRYKRKLLRFIRKIFNVKKKDTRLEKFFEKKIGQHLNYRNFSSEIYYFAEILNEKKFKFKEFVPNVYIIEKK